MSENDKPTNKTIEAKMEALGAMVAWFQSDEFVLEEAVAKYTEAEKLAEEIETDLTKIKNDIEVVKQRFNDTTPAA